MEFDNKSGKEDNIIEKIDLKNSEVKQSKMTQNNQSKHIFV